MRLSDYKNEEAIDVLADIIEPASYIMADPKVSEMFDSGKPKLLLVRYALKEHKQDVINLIAALHQKPVDELNFTIVSLVKDLLDIVNDPELQQVFTLQGQKNQDEPSGAVMEDTTAEGR